MLNGVHSSVGDLDHLIQCNETCLVCVCVCVCRERERETVKKLRQKYSEMYLYKRCNVYRNGGFLSCRVKYQAYMCISDLA